MGRGRIFLLAIAPFLTIILVLALQIKLWGHKIHDLHGYRIALSVSALSALLVTLSIIFVSRRCGCGDGGDDNGGFGFHRFALFSPGQPQSPPKPSSPRIHSPMPVRPSGIGNGAFAKPAF